MPWIGSPGAQLFQRTDGTRTGTQVWQQADAAGIDIVAPDHDSHDQDIGDGLSAALKKDGGNSATSDLPMGGFRFKNIGNAVLTSDSASAADVINERLNYCTVGGTANAIMLTHAVPIASYSAGQRVTFFALLSNTAAVTVAVDGLPPKSVNVAGSPLSAGQIIVGALITIVYNGTTGAFELAVGVTPAAVGVGCVMAWTMPTVPAGWLECDGSAVSRTSYAALFAVLQTSYGTGDGSTTFNLPNYKDYFLRGFDASGTDAASRTNRGDGTTGANVGTKQAGGVEQHTHAFSGNAVADHAHTTAITVGGGSFVANSGAVGTLGNAGATAAFGSSAAGGHTPSGSNGNYGGTETRPKNITVKWIILAIPSASVATAQVAPFFIRLLTDNVGTNDTSAQPVFSSGASQFTSPGSSLFEFEALFYITRAAGTTSHNTSLLFGGTATISSILYTIESTTTTGAPSSTTASQQLIAAVATAIQAATTSTSATENIVIKLKGTMTISVSGTVIPQFQYSTAPGGVPTVKAGSYIKFTPLGADTTGSFGPVS